MAGSIAYSAFISLFPIALLVLVAATILGGEAMRVYAMSLADRYLAPTSQGVVEESLEQARTGVEFSILGSVALLWAMFKVFRSLNTAFSTLYGKTTTLSIAEQLRDGVVVFGTMTVAVLTMVAVGTAVAVAPTTAASFAPNVPVVEIFGFLALVFGLVVAFLPMYYVFPNVPMTLEEALPGAVVAAVGWTLLQGLFQLYVSATSTNQLYGVVGAIILFITWLYFGAVVLLLGAATNVVLSGYDRRGNYGGPG